jgi:hypothetical protein
MTLLPMANNRLLSASVQLSDGASYGVLSRGW